MTWVVPIVAVSAVGDCLGLLHQTSSSDRPPIPAMVVVAVLAFATLVALPRLRRGQLGALRLAVATRTVDVLLLVSAAASGHVFRESADHVASAVAQFGLSLTAAVLLVACRAALLVKAVDQPSVLTADCLPTAR